METNETNIHEEVQPAHEQQRAKCHGNRKDQRFRQKCRARGMKSGKITKLLEKIKQGNHRQNQINGNIQNMRGDVTETIAPSHTLTMETNAQSMPTAITTISNTHKRKRDDVSQSQTRTEPMIPRSLSSVSIAQPASKKTKPSMIRMSLMTTNDDRINKNYQLVFVSIE
jgi:hypothetical protein